MSADLGILMAKLRSRPGRGGVRISYEEAQMLVRLLETGARAIARERNPRELTVEEFLEGSDVHRGPTAPGKVFRA